MGSKRKASEQSSGVTLSIDSSKAKVQPVLATFSAAVPPVASTFSTYRGISKSKSNDYIIVNESEKMEYVGKTFDGDRPLVDGCRYLIGVYDKTNDTVTFRQAPFVCVNSVIKSLKGARGVADKDLAGRAAQARNELGEAFGSKKRKAQIRAEERNRINMDGVQGDMKTIGASIELRAGALPTAQDLKAAEQVSRPVPRFNAETNVVAEVYDMEDLLPKAIAGQIDVSPFVKATDPKSYSKKIPVHSQFVHKKVSEILSQPKPDVARLRRVLYLSYLQRLNNLGNKQLVSRDACMEKICCSREVVDHLFHKFAECMAGSVNPDGSPVYRKTPATDNRLVCYIAVLMLSLSNWVLYPAELSGDLGIPGKKAEKYLLGVGCKLEPASAAEVHAYSNNKQVSSRSAKKAVLKAPIKFPKMSLRGN
ncbi:DNA-directed RNA polymerase I subunit rpa49 [Coemansia sp. RSA 2611]|nr:DNA-directed RNA polymerase I subunit rpa49 [Coemansia sp. RSA 2705]KAJ2321171.1 DNA-directed RNA polymerase I subunit rpa49 [Coemansia sp. RSA 2704]KAJ2383201.1 DNA-directed RNA polymerase I subunit rpa49 [Coemansia sp. RSA 2611]KAJ2738922.1 DNA-directed RNA polymerase I subunit rpa49 [Coemansia sp. Cherry 401B]